MMGRVLGIVGGIFAVILGLSLLLSFFLALYSSPEVILNDTDETIVIEPIIVAERDKTRRTFDPRLVIHPGEAEAFTFDWDDSRFWGNVLLHDGDETMSLCNMNREELGEEFTVWLGTPIPLIPHKESRGYLWSQFESCEIYSKARK